MYPASYNWGNIDKFHFEPDELKTMKKTCERHCFSTLNHNLSYCYDGKRVMKWIWKQAKNGFGSGARSFED
jgi:poly-gamma-glutamate capsule biosynthesis protein CapA/YwtB (metallophosphatase superfamily)